MSSSALGIADDRALGSSVRVIVTDPRSLGVAKAAVDQVLRDIDAAASRFREDSELSRLNARPELTVKVSPLLAQALAVALRAAELTHGAVDPTVGGALRLAGYDRDFAAVPSEGGALHLNAERIPGWRAIRFSPSQRTVVVPRGVEIDLGATAKALTADLAAAAARRAVAAGGVLVSLGGDISVAGEAPAGGWLVQASEDSGTPVSGDAETIALTAGGLATSSTTVRRWTRGGAVLHHIIDPATGLPVDGPWRTVTVAAGTCVDANVASTASIVLGGAAVAWLEHHGLAARLVDQAGRVLRIAGWPDPVDSKQAPSIF